MISGEGLQDHWSSGFIMKYTGIMICFVFVLVHVVIFLNLFFCHCNYTPRKLCLWEGQFAGGYTVFTLSDLPCVRNVLFF